MKKEILDLIKTDVCEIKFEVALRVKDVLFTIEEIENHLEVYSSENGSRTIFNDFDDVLKKFIINGKPLIEQIDFLEYA